MKRKTIVVLSILLTALMVIGGTLAYFTDEEEAVNVVTFGGVDIELTEELYEEATGGDFIMEDVMPGMTITKDPKITCVDGPCWLRVKVTISDCEALDTIFADEAEIIGNFVKGMDENWEVVGNIKNEDDTRTYVLQYKNLFEIGDEAYVFRELIIPTSLTQEEAATLGEDGIEITVTAEAMQWYGFENATDAFAAFDAE